MVRFYILLKTVVLWDIELIKLGITGQRFGT